ncbi:MAG: hypothetical protein AAF927_08275 [Bacteroidota bacterium]
MARFWNQSDERLIEKIKKGGVVGERAASDLYKRYKSYAQGVLFKKQFQADEIETLYLDTMSAAILNIRTDRFKAQSSFKTYLNAILLRKSQDFLRDKIKQREHFATQDQDYWTQSAPADEPAQALSEQEIVKLVEQIFGPQDPQTGRKSECLSIYEYLARGFDWDSIALRIGRSVQAAKNKRARCFEQLVKALKEQFPQQRQVLASMYLKIAKDYE